MKRHEPNWYDLFEQEIRLAEPQLANYQARIDAFEFVLKEWRIWHFTAVEINGKRMKRPASATDGIIELARLGIMSPRSELRDLPLEGKPSEWCTEEDTEEEKSPRSS